MQENRLEATRLIAAPAADIFAVLCDPQGHVAIDATGMLQDAEGSPVSAAGDTFVVHMDRESLGDVPEMGRYDVTVVIEAFKPDRLIEWSIVGTVRPPIGHRYGYLLHPEADSATDPARTLVTSYYDWSQISAEWAARGVFPVVSPEALKQSLGILERAVRRGYPRG